MISTIEKPLKHDSSTTHTSSSSILGRVFGRFFRESQARVKDSYFWLGYVGFFERFLRGSQVRVKDSYFRLGVCWNCLGSESSTHWAQSGRRWHLSANKNIMKQIINRKTVISIVHELDVNTDMSQYMLQGSMIARMPEVH